MFYHALFSCNKLRPSHPYNFYKTMFSFLSLKPDFLLLCIFRHFPILSSYNLIIEHFEVIRENLPGQCTSSQGTVFIITSFSTRTPVSWSRQYFPPSDLEQILLSRVRLGPQVKLLLPMFVTPTHFSTVCQEVQVPSLISPQSSIL